MHWWPGLLLFDLSGAVVPLEDCVLLVLGGVWSPGPGCILSSSVWPKSLLAHSEGMLKVVVLLHKILVRCAFCNYT